MLGKDYVPAATAAPSRPNESSPGASSEPGRSPVENEVDPNDEDEEEPSDDPIGPPFDVRAMDHKQWIVSVQIISNLRRLDVRLDRSRWNSFAVGDRVHVTYHEGKYTGTVWSTAID